MFWEKSVENTEICAGKLLDVTQAFDTAWLCRLKYKRVHLKKYYKILTCIKSYTCDQHFRDKYEYEYSEFKKIFAGVPKGSVPGSTFYLLYVGVWRNGVD